VAYSAKVSQFGYNVFPNYHRIMNKGMKVCREPNCSHFVVKYDKFKVRINY